MPPAAAAAPAAAAIGGGAAAAGGVGLGTATLVTGLAGAGVTGLGLALQDTPTPVGLVKLPPELEQQQLDIIQQSISDYQRERERAQAISGVLEQRANLQAQVASGLIPQQQALQTITRQNEQIAQQFGTQILGITNQMSADSGFGVGLENDIRTQAQRLATGNYEDFRDPTVEREIAQGEQQLREQLARQLGPGYQNSEAGIRALEAFRQGTSELRSNARNEAVQRLGTLTGVAQGTRASQLGLLNYLQGGRDNAQQALAAGIYAQNPASQNLVQAAQLGQQALNLGQVPFGQLQSFGQQQLSGDILGAIGSGQIKGIPDFITQAENFQASGGIPVYDAGKNQTVFVNPGTIPQFNQFGAPTFPGAVKKGLYG